MRQFFRLATVLLGTAGALSGAPALAATQGTTSVYDLSVLPAFSGTVSQYIPSPSGGIIGLLLNDGTEVLVSPAVADALPGLVKPGEQVSGNGLRGKTLPLIRAFTVSAPRGRRTEDTGITFPQHAPEMIAGPDLVAHGTVWRPLYNVQGSVTGVVLKDRTVIMVPPRSAPRIASLLTPGAMIYAAGPGTSGAQGTALNARQIGQDGEHMVPLSSDDMPPPGPPPGSPGYDLIPLAETH